MGKKTATKSDRLFEETKLRMVMRLNNMTRRQAAADIANRARTTANAAKRSSCDDLLTAEEFFGEA
jgi:hypothetical protein